MRRRAACIALAVLALIAGLIAGAGWWGWDRYTRPGPLAESRTLIIPKGSGLAEIARQLEAAGVIDRPLVFRLGVRRDGLARSLRAGEYEFPAHISMRDAARLLGSGRTVRRRLTVAEGLTASQVLALVRGADGLEGQVPDAGIREGSLLPETYFYGWGDSRSDIVRRMREAMAATVARLWQNRAEGLAVNSPREAVILASIIEKETGLAAERPRVSAVFHNRLRRGMRLQSDPTVVYALTHGAGPLGRPLTRADLAVTSPFNTYVHGGLPPGPIANPGIASIEAALNPARTRDLYFVADGNGGHLFARTLAEHNRNVARWRRLQRDRRKAQEQ